MIRIFKNYCLNTNLHGFIYIAQKNRHKIERIFWSLFIFISFILTGFLINKLIQESQKNAIIIYTDQNVVHVENISFPAVSVCPGIVLHTPMNDNLAYNENVEKFESVTVWEEILLKRLQIASLFNRDNFVQNNFQKQPISTEDFVERMHDFPPFFFTTYDSRRYRTMSFFDATWLRNFLANFTQTFWKQGFCYTFNFPKVQDLFHLEKMSKDFNYKTFTPGINSYNMISINATSPFKSPLPGDGLAVRYNREWVHIEINKTDNKFDRIFYFNIFDVTAPKSIKRGHRFLFHDSYEVVPFNAKNFYSNMEFNSKILVTPNIRRIDETLKSEKLDVRNCYLPNERNLKFLKVYNKVNCEHECLTQMTLEKCKCVQFFMVRDNKTRICGARDEKCYRNVEDHFDNAKARCKCYENCDNIKYEFRVAFTTRPERQFFDMFQRKEAKVFIEMSSHVFLAVNKRQSSTTIDLLSLSGGFLGLFAGFSVLSAIEIVYYFAISPLIQFQAKMSTRVYPLTEKLIKKRKSEKLIKKCLKKMLQESTVHSFNHIGNEQKSRFERVTWIFLFISSMICTYFMVIQVYKKSNLNGVSITMEGSTTRVEDIPFPAVTIQANSYDYSKSFDISRMIRIFYSQNLGSQMTNSLLRNKQFTDLRRQVLALVCRSAIMKLIKEESYNFTSSTAVKDDFKDYIQETNQFYWYATKLAIYNISFKAEFAEIMTKFGVSYTFNMIESSKLVKTDMVSSDFAYSYPISVNYPVKFDANPKRGLYIAFVSRRFDYACTRAGFSIHSPYEFPLESEFVDIDSDKMHDIWIIPSIIKADEELRKLPVSFRKCYFENDKELKFFKIYTQQNCEFECLAAVLYEKCNCVPFYFIRSPSWDICEYRRMKFCVEKYMYERSIGNISEKADCGCLPACNSVSYTYEIVETNYIFDEPDINLMTIMYRDSEYYALLRYQEFKLVDFLSYVGGILGLFAGISVLSFVEILYFITLRLITDLSRKFIK